jgi:hypothetical protein
VSHSNGTGGMAPQPGAGSNTASLDTHFGGTEQPRLRVQVTTIDDAIAAGQRDGREAQVLRSLSLAYAGQRLLKRRRRA